ncbi:unnamed protein product [Prorocentrum cordatum]|uniref:Aquaporin n=1 Tax=Prorocentrum cordatum TaxID=2364126 RepID=A0ABN9T332_9DINO|nr:unnamed protein product [Polarella glacialis]
MLCLVFLNCDAQRQKGAQFTGAAAGLVLVASGVSATAVSGGCLNPAAALAIDLAGKRLGFGASLGYVAHELLGAAAAGALVRILRPPAEPGRPPERGGALAAVAAEFVGTFLLAFTATLGALFGAPGEAAREPRTGVHTEIQRTEHVYSTVASVKSGLSHCRRNIPKIVIKN